MKSSDVMVDLETLGTNSGCIILSIGACTFDMDHKFYTTIREEDSKKYLFEEDPETVAWWAKQKKEAFDEARAGSNLVVEALGNFSSWLNMLERTKGQVFVWGNGADFDLPILSHYYRTMDMSVPWKPYNGRCYRTLKNLYQDIKIDDNPGKHNALEDACYQAAHARRLLSHHFSRSQD